MKFSGIRAKLNIVGGLFTLVLIVLVVVVIIMNNSQKKDAYVVNVAGLERMLTQKMSKEVIYLHFKDSNDFRELNSALNLFEYNLNNLINGNRRKSIEPPSDSFIYNKLLEVKKQWIPFKSEILKIQAGINSAKDDILTLSTKTEKLLNFSQEIVTLMVKNNLPATYIDLSGRQRMLSQRIGLFANDYIKHKKETSYMFLLDAKKLYANTINNFLEDELIKRNSLLFNKVSQTHKYWNDFEKFLTRLLKSENLINSSIEYIFLNNSKLLATMDEAVTLYTHVSEDKNQKFLNIIYIIAFIAILITIYAYILTKDVILHVDDFVDKAKMLASSDFTLFDKGKFLSKDAKEDELNIASLHIADYVNKVNQAMQHSNDTISKAESVADELQKLATDMGKVMQTLNIDESEKNRFNKKVSAAEDIAIESTENLINVSKILTKLQTTLSQIVEKNRK